MDADQEGWLVAYADLITLLFIFFAVLLSVSVVSHSKLEALAQKIAHQGVGTLSDLKKQLDEKISERGMSARVSTTLSDEGLQIQFQEQSYLKRAPQKRRTFYANWPYLGGWRPHRYGQGHTDDRVRA